MQGRKVSVKLENFAVALVCSVAFLCSKYSFSLLRALSDQSARTIYSLVLLHDWVYPPRYAGESAVFLYSVTQSEWSSVVANTAALHEVA